MEKADNIEPTTQSTRCELSARRKRKLNRTVLSTNKPGGQRQTVPESGRDVYLAETDRRGGEASRFAFFSFPSTSFRSGFDQFPVIPGPNLN